MKYKSTQFQEIESSPHKSFTVTQLCRSVAICEAVNGDRYNWGNEEEDQPAFIVYLGCRARKEAEAVSKTLLKFYRATKCLIREGKRLDYPFEIKVYGLQRESDSYCWGLDDLVLSRSAREEEKVAQMYWEEHQKHCDHFLATADYYDSAWAD